MNPTTKICSDCGIDLNGQKRVKDPSGNYFCPNCWDARVKASQQRNVEAVVKPEDQPMSQRLRAAAEQLVKNFADGDVVHLKFDLDGVRWVDGYINRNRSGFPKGQREGLVAYLAAFVGECIIATFGGEWTLGDHGLYGVSVTKHVWACPLAKIEKQFENGASDSVFGFVEMIPTLDKHIASGAIPSSSSKKK
jgi:hypothetical protein